MMGIPKPERLSGFYWIRDPKDFRWVVARYGYYFGQWCWLIPGEQGPYVETAPWEIGEMVLPNGKRKEVKRIGKLGTICLIITAICVIINILRLFI